MAEAVRKALAPHVPATRGGNNRGDGTCSTTLKYRIFGHPRFLLRGLRGAQTEIGLAIMAYNLKRMIDVLVAVALNRKLNPA
jgi:hypothetical protein